MPTLHDTFSWCPSTGWLWRMSGNQPPLYQLLHVLAPGHVAHHHHKLVAAQAAHRVAAAHGLREARGHRAQQAVANVVA